MRPIPSVIALAAIVSCGHGSNDPAARLATARPHLAAAAQAANEILAGARRCQSPVPGYPGCEHDHGQVLLIAPDVGSGAGRRVPGLLFVPPDRRPALAMTLWHFDSLGAPLGHGWRQVTAIAHVD